MSKESRRRQRAAGQTSGAGHPDARGGGTSTDIGRPAATRSTTRPRGSDRVGRRERARAVAKPSFVERYRSLLVGAAIVAVVAVVGAGLFAAATTPAFACSTVWQPEPTPTPVEGSSPQSGFVEPDMGQAHVSNGTQVTYTYCPPASGRHYQAPQGPIPARLYGPGDSVIPQGWVHNLEHGGLVILYRGEQADQAALRATYDAIPVSPICGFQPGGQSPGPVVARFDQMAWPYAAIVWGRVLPMETLDSAAILDFYARYGETTNPEPQCERPDPSALPSATPAPSVPGSPAPSPSASAAPTGSAAPSAGQSTVPSPS